MNKGDCQYKPRILKMTTSLTRAINRWQLRVDAILQMVLHLWR